MNRFEPKIVGFLCSWCAYEGADSAGRARSTYPANLRVVRLLCSGRMDPHFILEAFKEGADGIMILGCHLGECHYKEGNFQALKRTALLKKILPQFGIEEQRVRLDWISTSEHEKFAKIVSEIVEKVRELGPMRGVTRGLSHGKA
ncbi:MAG: hydrogenase iron-sulfur subunit [Deltaproteobacteria bacterium]|nr:MAG: hydrogenase iron-sulfur subunit [Deltaproteobacteria bacterium]